ncbi:hypothetical protein LguiA_003860 [Lonicera macranthoides]
MEENPNLEEKNKIPFVLTSSLVPQTTLDDSASLSLSLTLEILKLALTCFFLYDF